MRFTSLLLAAGLLVSVVRAEVRIAGSDLLGDAFTVGLAAYGKRNDLGLSLALEGSRAGLEKLNAGLADIGVVVLGPGEMPPTAPLVALPVAYHTALAVVPAGLPLTQITLDQLDTIYGDAAQSTLKRWSDLGVTGEWASRSIQPNLVGGGLTYDLFRYTVLKTPSLKPTVGVQGTLAESLARIRGDEGGMTVLPVLPAGHSHLKVLLVARTGRDVAFGPTAENLYSGDYPIRLPVYLVFKKESAWKLRPVLRYLLAEDAVELWQSAQVVPVPSQVRNQQIVELETMASRPEVDGSARF